MTTEARANAIVAAWRAASAATRLLWRARGYYGDPPADLYERLELDRTCTVAWQHLDALQLAERERFAAEHGWRYAPKYCLHHQDAFVAIGKKISRRPLVYRGGECVPENRRVDGTVIHTRGPYEELVAYADLFNLNIERLAYSWHDPLTPDNPNGCLAALVTPKPRPPDTFSELRYKVQAHREAQYARDRALGAEMRRVAMQREAKEAAENKLMTEQTKQSSRF